MLLRHWVLRRHLALRADQLVEGVDRAHLRVVLDGLAIGGDEVDGGEGLGVHLRWF